MAKNKFSSRNIFVKNFPKEFSKFLSHKKYSKHFILVDDHTANYCLPILLKEVPVLTDAIVIEIFSGEQFKNLESTEHVWEQLTEHHADRNSVLINVGGGVVCDLGGFAAGTYKRGIDFIHVPTTLLSQVDAAHGGKQGIDFFHYKNQIGIFKNPEAVFVNTEFLKTLPALEIVNGFAEVVKHGLLSGGKFWKEIKAIGNLEEVNWGKIVSDSMAIKLEVTDKDPYEKGLRKILNFGHTIGHAVETDLMNKGKPTLHGFCVAAGMMGELFLSVKSCGFSEKKMWDAIAFINGHFPPVYLAGVTAEELLALMQQDKKNRNGRIQFSLLKKTGEPVINVEMKDQDIRDALEFIKNVYEKEKE